MKYCVVGASYSTDHKGTSVILSTRDENNNRRFFKVPYLPYFYYKQSQEKLLGRLLEKVPELQDYIVKEERYFYSTKDEQLVKLYVKWPIAVKEFSKRWDFFKKERLYLDFYESNVLYTYRFMIDHRIFTGVDEKLRPVECESRHRILYMDIEVEGEDEWKEDSFKYPIIIIGLYDSYTSRYYILYIGSKHLDLGPSVETLPFEDEDSLLRGFIKLYSSISPDVIVTFSPFDISYIINRFRKKKLDYTFLSPIGMVTRGPHIHCVDILDYAELYRRVFSEQLWNTLDFIAQKELGYGKIKLEGPIHEVWKVSPEEVIKYNYRDVKLLVDLEEKLQLISSYIVPIWRITGLKFSDCLVSNRIGDILYLRRSRETGYVWRSRSFYPKEEYRGALVEAIPGIYTNVAILDWSELYPSIMETFHISWDTLSYIGGENHVKIKEGLYFSLLDPGESNILMRPLRKVRREIKENLKACQSEEERRKLKMLSSAYKSVINSIYGLYGYKSRSSDFGSRVYEPAVASAITMIGRLIYKETVSYCSSIGYEVVYGDTDSIFILLKREDLEEESRELAEEITGHISTFIKEKYRLESTLKLSCEHILRRVIILTKKRYAGVTYSGEFIVKGLEIVRKNSANITIKVERDVIDILLNGGSLEDVEAYKRKIKREVLNGDIPLEDLALRPRCSKEDYDTLTSNLKAIIIGEHYTGEKIRPNCRFYKLYLLPTEKIRKTITINEKESNVLLTVDVIGLKEVSKLPSHLVVDLKKMARVVIERPIDNITSPLKKKVFKEKTLISFIGDTDDRKDT